MKNISLAINAILIVAVAFLFYKTFSGASSGEAGSASATDSLVQPVVPLSAKTLASLPKGVPFAFVNADTIFAHYEFAKKAKAAGEGRVASYQKSYQLKVEAFQKEYDDYVQKAGAGGYTKEQGQAIEAGLQKKKDDIVLMEQNQDKVMAELDHSTIEVQGKVYNYLSRFNKEHGYYCALAYTLTGGGVLGINDSLDVTRQVLEGLNAEYKAVQNK
jgi:outer membrane protein